jgi:ethanolamine kinase
MWGIWALIQSKYSAIDFDFLNYAVQRLGEYKRNLKLNNYYTIQP